MKFSMPYPPTNNNYFTVARGRKILSSKGRCYLKDAGYWIKAQTRDKFPEDARLKVIFDVFPPDRRKRDLDNLPKALLDAMQGSGVLPDDSQVDELIIRRQEVVKKGRVNVELREAS